MPTSPCDDRPGVLLGDALVYDPAASGRRIRVVRTISVQVRSPTSSLDPFVRELGHELRAFMHRGDLLVLRGLVAGREGTLATVEVVRPEDGSV